MYRVEAGVLFAKMYSVMQFVLEIRWYQIILEISKSSLEGFW
jgi:hypothetical protein